MDWKKLGLKIGLEVHQQLATKKLFCNCSSEIREQKLVTELKRRIYPVVGETGKIDVATAYEVMKKRTFIYYGYEGEACLVDCDDEPPHEINKEALKIALGVALKLKLEIPDVLCVMRKNVSDGSACSSFQRTMIIGKESKNSFIPTSQGNVRVTELYLEEDACKIKKKEKDKVYYSLSRQGIPLLELRTDPDIKSPEQAKEAAEYVGMVFRSFLGMRKGIGTIRQDINLSIKKGARVEIKGFQDIRKMPGIIKNEINRQLEIIKKGRKVREEVRKAEPDGLTKFLRPLPGAARMYPETDLPLIKITKEMVEEAKKSLPKLKHEIREELKSKLHSELVSALIKENKIEDYYHLLEIYNKPALVAKMLTIWPKEISRREKVSFDEVSKKFDIVVLKNILENVKKGNLDESRIQEVMFEIIKGKPLKKAIKVEKADMKKIEKEVEFLIQKKPGLSIKAYMGLLMKKYKGKISGAKVVEIIKKHL